MADFFISYNSADLAWAEWIAYVVEEGGSTVIIQAWDFRPGTNFVLEMQKAASEADRTIMVLSPDYIKSQFTSPEWAAAFSEDPQGLERKLVPVVIRQCETRGLLKPLVHINLVGVDESRASALLMDGLNKGRSKPSKRPSFPGGAVRPSARYPGAKPTDSTPRSSAYMPKVRRPATDADKVGFMRHAFEVIRTYFEAALDEIGQRNDAIEYDFQPHTATEFLAEIFLSGSSKCRCRIWQGGMLSGEVISYAEGRHHYGNNSFNESLALLDDRGALYLTSLMGISFGHLDVPFDLKRMTQEQAAEYLWRRFVAPLER
jgi:hypothetical protein